MKFNLNLASRSYVNRRALYFGYVVVAVLLLAVLVLNLMTLIGLQQQSAQTQQKIDAIEHQMAERNVAVADYSEQKYATLQRSVAAANDILRRDSFRWTELLDRLEGLMPKHVRLQSVSPDIEKQSIALTCEARDLTALKRFLDNLYASGHYQEVYLSQQSVDDKTRMIKFSVQLKGAF